MHDLATQFRASRWFTRGWTLQELLASKEVVFFGAEWKLVGTRSTLVEEIAIATGIETTALSEPQLIHEWSTAKRMSWASRRETTRIEDMAYSLLGIFEINMPLLYGEGEQAFQRLQEELTKISDDETLFAHNDVKLLASTPLQFRSSRDILPSLRKNGRQPYSMTNKGLHIQLPIWQQKWPDGTEKNSLECLTATFKTIFHTISGLNLSVHRLPTYTSKLSTGGHTPWYRKQWPGVQNCGSSTFFTKRKRLWLRNSSSIPVPISRMCTNII